MLSDKKRKYKLINTKLQIIGDIPDFIKLEFPYLCGKKPRSPYDYCDKYLNCSVKRRHYEKYYGEKDVTICDNRQCSHKKMAIFVEKQIEIEYKRFIEAMKQYVDSENKKPERKILNRTTTPRYMGSFKKGRSNEKCFGELCEIIDDVKLAIKVMKEFKGEQMFFQKGDISFLNEGISKYNLTSEKDMEEWFAKNREKYATWDRLYIKGILRKYKLRRMIGDFKFRKIYETDIRYGFIFKPEYLNILVNSEVYKDYLDEVPIEEIARKYKIYPFKVEQIIERKKEGLY